MNQVIKTTMYRGMTEKKITGEDIYLTAAGVISLLSITLGVFLAGWFWFLLMIPCWMVLVGGEFFYQTPEDYKFKYIDKLEAKSFAARDTVSLLGDIMRNYSGELKVIISPDLLFDEVWDQVSLVNITDESLHDYYMKLKEIKSACEKIRKENLIAGRSVSTDMVDLALETAKEFQK